MTRRIPLWAALLPPAIGLAAYWLYWQAEAATFRDAVQRLVPNSAVESGGFPYRIEARLPRVSVRAEAGGARVSIAAGNSVINRQPWRTDHIVIAAAHPRILLTLPDIAGARLAVEAPAVLASLRRPGDIVERLSMQFEAAKVRLPLAGAFDARDFELHLRETPTPASHSASPRLPVQAEARIAGMLTRAGTTFRIELPLYATAAQRIQSVTGWRRGGTLEIRGGRLTAADGAALAGFDATLAPLPDGRIVVAGTIDTDCPATIIAWLAGKAAVQEFRSRRMQRLPITGIGNDLVPGAPGGASGGPVRSREPPCPALHR